MKRRTMLLGAAGVVGIAALGGVRVLTNTFDSAAPLLASRQKLRMPPVLDATGGKPIALTACVAPPISEPAPSPGRWGTTARTSVR